MSNGNYRDGVWPQQKKLRLWYKTKRGNQPGAVKGIHYRREDSKAASETREWSQWDTDLDEEEPQATDTSGSSSSSSVEAGIQEDQDEIITEIDVLYGQGRPSWDFQRVKNGPVVEAVAKKHESVDIVVRRGNPGEFESRSRRVWPSRSHRDRASRTPRLASAISRKWQIQDPPDRRPPLLRFSRGMP